MLKPFKKVWWPFVYVDVVDDIEGRGAFNIPFYIRITKKNYRSGHDSWVLEQEKFESRWWTLRLLLFWPWLRLIIWPSNWCKLECKAHARELRARIEWDKGMKYPDGRPNKGLIKIRAMDKAKGMVDHSTYWYFRSAGWTMEDIVEEMLWHVY